MMTCVAASVGVYIDMFTRFQAGFLTTIIGVGLMLALIATPDNGKNTKLRLGYLLGFGLTSGMQESVANKILISNLGLVLVIQL